MLFPALGVQKIQTGIYGPLPPGTVGLLMGRSSLTSQGAILQIGIIDSDCKDEIQVTMQTWQLYQIEAGDHTGQLLLLPYTMGHAAPVERAGGFAGTGRKFFGRHI